MSKNSKVYLSLLADVLEKKENLLGQLILETIKQSHCFQVEALLEEQYDEICQKKTGLISELEKLDEGFESLYQRVKVEIKENRYEYEQEIKGFQQKIRSITDKSIQLQKLESENKVKYELFHQSQRKKIKDIKVSKKTAATQYKNMMQQFSKDSVL